MKTPVFVGLGMALFQSLACAASLSVLVLDKDGKPAPDAVVTVLPAGNATPLKMNPVAVTVAQEKMQFVPALTLVAAGSTVRFVNNDAWDHHVRGSAAGIAQFNSAGGFELRLAGKADSKPASQASVTLDKAGPVMLGCHLHGSMRGHIFVSDSPWAAKTNADGVAQFDGLPEGSANVKTWHADQYIDQTPQLAQLGGSMVKVTAQLNIVPKARRRVATSYP
ncbi:MAG: hypothetical protein RLZZ401_494 [Pseudomonadota bacterium]|jgi:plastocyanin